MFCFQWIGGLQNLRFFFKAGNVCKIKEFEKHLEFCQMTWSPRGQDEVSVVALKSFGD